MPDTAKQQAAGEVPRQFSSRCPECWLLNEHTSTCPLRDLRADECDEPEDFS